MSDQEVSENKVEETETTEVTVEATETAEVTETETPKAVEAAPEATEESKDSEEEEEEETGLKKGLAKGDAPEFKWYVAHCLTNYENKVSRALKERIINLKMTEFFADILIPEEQVVTNVNGKKRNIKKKFFPGYILIKMNMTKAAWHCVKHTDKITGFLGGNKNTPVPITDAEAAAMLNQETGGFQRSRTNISFSEGDAVKVTEGPFATFTGTVEQVGDKGKLKVNVSIFGRPTPVELDFTQVEKV